MIGFNKVIKTLIISDFLLQCGWGLIGPIFAIFLIKQIEGGTLVTVGFIAATFWVTKSISQPAIAYFLDLKKGEIDDFNFLVRGMYVANLIPLGYLFSTQIWHLFLLEFIRALAMACVVPSWFGIFTRHIDKGWEAFSWSLQSTGMGLAAGFAAAFGGVIAAFLGFRAVFVLVTIFGLFASSFLLLIRQRLFTKNHFVSKAPLEEPKTPPETKL